MFKIDKINSTQGTLSEQVTGPRLILCKEFIDIHKGMIEVESPLGNGTTFSIILYKENSKD